MKQIYIEIVLFDNFIMDFLILYFTARLSDRRVRLSRLSTGAAVGAVYSATALAIPFLKCIVFKLFCSIAMCLPMGLRPNRLFLKRVTFFYAVTFIFGGAIYFLVYWFGGDISGGYINLPILRYLLMGGVISSFIIESFLRVHYPSRNIYYVVRGEIAGETFRLNAFLDTGNQLADAGGGSVIIAEKEAVLRQLSFALREKLFCPALAGVPVRRFYFTTVSGRGEMYSFLPDSLTISDGRNTYVAKAYVALSETRFSANYNAVLGQNIRLLHLKKEAPLEQATPNTIHENIPDSICTPESLLHKRQRSFAAPSYKE